MKRKTFLGFLAIAGCSRGPIGDSPALEAAIASLPTKSAVLGYRTAGRRIVIAHNIDSPLPAASLIKLLVASAVAMAVQRHHLSLTERLTPTTSVLSRASSERWGRDDRARRPLSEYLNAMLSDSDNFAANVLIDKIGIAAINAHAVDLGLKVTRIHGYFVDSVAHVKPRSFTTAREILALLTVLLQGRSDETPGGEAPFAAIYKSLSAQEDRRMIPAAVGENAPVANKTGEISGVLNDAAIIGQPTGSPLIEIILSDGNPPLTSAPDYLAAINNIKTVSLATYLATR